jgi:transcriptional regulator with XRE-family HTH domain
MTTAKRKAMERANPAQPNRADGPNLGDCLRRLRFDRKLSLTDVSTLTGISKSTLSRVESDQLSLTYDKLLQLCRGLQIDLTTFFDPNQGSIRELGRRTFNPAGLGRAVSVNLQDYNYLCTELAGKKMTPMTGIIRSCTLAESNGLLKHEGEEFTYVLEGTLELHTEFYEPLVLEVGSSVYFDSTMAHAYVSVGAVPGKMLCVCSTPEPALTRALDAVKPLARRDAPPGRRAR